MPNRSEDMTPITPDAINSYVRLIVKRFNPQTVLLFGSQAAGTSDGESDVDLLVIMDHDKPRNVDQEIEIDCALPRVFPLDILVRRPSDVKRRLAANDMVLKGLLKTGKPLYARTRCHT
jgi:predicted nucleotidyltransferase